MTECHDVCNLLSYGSACIHTQSVLEELAQNSSTLYVEGKRERDGRGGKEGRKEGKGRERRRKAKQRRLQPVNLG